MADGEKKDADLGALQHEKSEFKPNVEPKKAKDTLQIYARVRKIMPWEPDIKSIKYTDQTIETLGKVRKSYTFSKVFDPTQSNRAVFEQICKPMCEKVLEGFNAITIAYGQTGSGKTHSLLGKPKRKVVGILPMVLEYFLERAKDKDAPPTKVQISALEAFGHHVNRIEIYDLFDKKNHTKNWGDKEGNTMIARENATILSPKDAEEGRKLIEKAHAASHFAPTGKNPESSRGHISFIIKIKRQPSEHSVQTSYFVISDLAGSEGETAFTPAFKRKVDPSTLVARRLEAGVINTGLSQLQIIFNELKFKGHLSKMVGVGLRRVLHPYINNRCVLSVLFCISPSKLNIKATTSTLKFAVQAGMVTVKPIKERVFTNWPTLVKGLNENISNLNKDIDERDRIIAELEAEVERLRGELANAQSGPPTVQTDLPSPASINLPDQTPNSKSHTRQRSQLPTNIIAMFNMAQDEIEEMDEMTKSQLLVADVKEDEVDAEVDQALQASNDLRGDTDTVASVFGEKTEELIRTGRQSTINLLHLNDTRASIVDNTSGDGTRRSLKAPLQIPKSTKNTPASVRSVESDMLDVLDEDMKLDELDDLNIDFEDPQLDLETLTRPQLVEHCDVLRSMLEAEKTLNESYIFSQQVIIDHLAETNEGLLAYFRVKFQVLGDGKKKKKKKKSR